MTLQTNQTYTNKNEQTIIQTINRSPRIYLSVDTLGVTAKAKTFMFPTKTFLLPLVVNLPALSAERDLWTAFIFSPRTQTYLSLVTFFIFVLLLCGILAALAYVLSLTASQDTEKRSEYECGFAPFDSATRHPFEVHFYVVGILFLIFDVEIALLFPWVLTIEATGIFSYIMMAQFVYILAIGFHYE